MQGGPWQQWWHRRRLVTAAITMKRKKQVKTMRQDHGSHAHDTMP